MRNVIWIIAASLTASTTACVDMNTPYSGGSGYGYAPSGYPQSYAPAYSSGYGAYSPAYSSRYNPNYYRPAPVNNYYVQPQRQVVYVPVHGGQDRRWNYHSHERRWDNYSDRGWERQGGRHRGHDGQGQHEE